MRKGLLSSVATALVGAGSALAQTPYLPTDATGRPTGPTASMPALLSADPAAPPAASGSTAPPTMSCGSTGLTPGVDCLPASLPSHEKFWGDISYMLAWIKNGPNPGPLGVITPIGGGVINTGSAVLVGNQDTQFDGQNGVRASAGMWFGCDAKVGFEARGFVLERMSDSEAVGSSGAATVPVNLIRPFFNANTGTVSGVTIGGPGLAGGIVSDTSTRFWGAEGNLLLNWRDEPCRRVDLYAGFVYYDLLERLNVVSVSGNPGGPGVALSDSIDTRNQFYGGQVGMKSTWTRGRFTLIGSGGLALGVEHEVVDRLGGSTGVVGGVPVGTNSGFLVQASNRGRVSQDKFAVAMPSNLTLSYQVTDHMAAFIGYDFVYLSRTARPGDQIDLAFQTNGTGTTVRPLGGIHSDDFWMNAGLIGVKFKF
jgi:Putative beta barrel porin-7 (BBP7)